MGFEGRKFSLVNLTTMKNAVLRVQVVRTSFYLFRRLNFERKEQMSQPKP